MVGEPFSAVFQNLSGSGKSIWIRRRGVSTFSVESFLCHSAENFAREPLCAVFQNSSVSEKAYE